MLMNILFSTSNTYTRIAISIIKSWQSGSTFIRSILISAFFSFIISISIIALGEKNIISKQYAEPIAIILIGYFISVVMIAFVKQEIRDQAETEQQIVAVQERARENPKETQAAWELARVKLESYLNRNINQVQAIFWLTLFVMVVGFALIIYGVYISYTNTNLLQPSIIAACSGILVNFIGVTFLVIYRSTMAQARDYVTVLERINAVGMAVQILDTIDDKDGTIKPQATADLAKQLLQLYTSNERHAIKNKKIV